MNFIAKHVDTFVDRCIDRVTQGVTAKINAKMPPLAIGPQDTHIYTHSSDGHRLFLDAFDKHITLHVLEHGCWEDHIRVVLMNTLKPGGVFVDVGANVGLHSLFAASLVGSNGRVEAFEPLPRTYNTLRLNIDVNGMNGIIRAHPFAVGEQKEFRSFDHFESHAAMSGFTVPQERLAHFGETEACYGRTSVRKFPVKVVALDTFLTEKHVDVLKIDVEGFETLVLRGAKETIQNNTDICIIMEWDTELISRTMNAEAVQENIDFLKQEGFRAYTVSSVDPLTAVSWDDERLRGAMTDLVASRVDLRL